MVPSLVSSCTCERNSATTVEMAKLVIAKPKLLFLYLLLQLRTQLAVSRYRVEFLPGFQGPLPFYLETGYVGVGDSEDTQLFYYFVKSEENPEKDPLIIWLSGGPGCTSFNGLVYEIGPINFNIVEYNGSLPTLVLNPNSWTKKANILFLDSPVGTGFSYARTPRATQAGDSVTTHQVPEFLRKWLMDVHPEFLLNLVYIAGDSYSGKTVPAITEMISKENEENIKPLINLQGYILGNPMTDPPKFEQNSAIPFAHGMGLISDELYESLKRTCRGEYQIIEPSNTACLNDIQVYQSCISGISPFNILGIKCSREALQEKSSKRRSLTQNAPHFIDLEEAPLSIECHEYRYLLSGYWANDKSVQKALNIRESTVGEWLRCNRLINYTEEISSSIPYHAKLSVKGYRSLIFNGDHDMIVPFVGTQAWIRSLNYSIVDDWRPWNFHDQVAGYTRTYSNKMTFATVKGAGHIAPEDFPAECYAMFSRWISHDPL